MTKDVAADLIAAIEKQRAKGVREYGKGVDPLDNYDWIDEGGSELIDCWVYLLAHKNLVRHLKTRVAELEETQKQLQEKLHSAVARVAELEADEFDRREDFDRGHE